MTTAAIDADAFFCVHSFDLLAKLSRAAGPLILCTGYVARIELNDLADELERLTASGLLEIKTIRPKSPAGRRLRQLRKQHRQIHKGEAETLAWIMEESPKTPFVTCDSRARVFARECRVRGWDVLDLVHEWLAQAILTPEVVEASLSEWVDDPHSRWRPKDFISVDRTLRQRYGSEFGLSLRDRK